jgi:hypothetical protein
VRSLTPVQLALAFALGGSVVAVAVPAFLENIRASRMAEPLDGLRRIATAANALAAGSPPELAYPDSVPLTPERVPQGGRVLDPPGTWSHSTWRRLGFSWDVEHSYSFEFESHNSPKGAVFVARAFGDLDGDGVRSTFSVSGEVQDGKEPVVFPMSIQREVE